MATHLITPNEVADGSPGDGSSVLLFGGHSSRLLVANPLIPRLFEEVSEGVRSLPRGGAEIGGLLVGPKGHEGGIVAEDIIPIPIEYRFGPSFRLSSPDLTKIEEAIATLHKDESKTVVGFYRSRTRGGAEFRDSDQEILLAVELAHAAFATDFHYYLVLSPPARNEMALGLAVRTGNDWSEFRPFTCHMSPAHITNDLGDPEPEEAPVEAPPAAELESLHTEEAVLVEEAAVPVEEPSANPIESAAPEAETAAAPEMAPAESETMNVHTEEAVAVETEASHTEHHEPEKSDMEALNANPQTAKTEAAPKPRKPRAPKAEKPETAAKPRAKKTTTSSKPRTPRAAAAGKASAEGKAHADAKTKTPVAAAAAVVGEPKPMLHKEPELTVEHLFKMRTPAPQFDWKKFTSKISRHHLVWAAGIIAAATLAAAGYLLLTRHTPAQPSATHPVAVVSQATKQKLALTAERRGSDLVLSWNKEAPTVARANYGMLIIRGKDTRRDIALTPDQLRAGSIVYTPTTDQVEVELSVVDGEQVTKDSVIVLLPRKGDKNAIVTSANIQDSPQQPSAQVSSAQSSERERPLRASSSPPGHQPLKPFAMPTSPAGSETAGVVHLEDPPPALAQRSGPAGSVIALPNPQLPSAPSAPAPVTEAAVAQNKAPDKAAPSSVMTPAVATEQVMPHVPETAKALLLSARTIEVTVNIDENGKVLKAEAPPANRADSVLVAAAIEAARRWKFHPARLNNKPISSEMIVKFNFAPVR